MTTPTNHPDHHINAVLEPVAPGSQYDFIEIESNPIKFGSPLGKLPGFLGSIARSIKWCVRTQWKTALVFLIVVIGAEFALRSYEPRLVGRIYSQTHTGGHPLAINAQGFRGDPVELPKPENTVRILALGDSVTFGTGIANEHTWPAQLEQLLNANDQSNDLEKNQQVELINAALPALDLEQIERELIERWSVLEPDHAVLMVTGNMVSFGYARRDREVVSLPNPKKRAQTPESSPPSTKDAIKDIYASFALPGALTMGMEHLKFAIGLESHETDPAFPTGVMLAHGYTQNGIETDTIDQAWAIFKEQLGSFALAARQLGIPLTVVYSPPRFVLSEDRSENLKWVDTDRLTVDPIERTRSICHQLNIRFIDPSVALNNAPKPVYALSDYTHFEESGHQVIAEVIAELFSGSISGSIKNP